MPTIGALLTVTPAACGVLGGFIALWFPANSDRRILENILLGFGLGAAFGTTLAFAIWIGAMIGGA